MMPAIQDSKTLQEWRVTAPFWKKHSGTIRIMFAPLTEALIEDASISEGQTVLDVAGGPGEPSLTIATTPCKPSSKNRGHYDDLNAWRQTHNQVTDEPELEVTLKRMENKLKQQDKSLKKEKVVEK